MAASGGANPQLLSKDEVIARYQRMRQDEQTKRSKIQELLAQEAEFRMVIETLKPVDPDRRCYHQIGGVLAERTVKEVLPVLEVNRDGLAKLLGTLEAEFSKTVQERTDFQRLHGIQMVPQSLLQQAQRVVQGAGGAEGGAAGAAAKVVGVV